MLLVDLSALPLPLRFREGIRLLVLAYAGQVELYLGLRDRRDLLERARNLEAGDV